MQRVHFKLSLAGGAPARAVRRGRCPHRPQPQMESDNLIIIPLMQMYVERKMYIAGIEK